VILSPAHLPVERRPEHRNTGTDSRPTRTPTRASTRFSSRLTRPRPTGCRRRTRTPTARRPHPWLPSRPRKCEDRARLPGDGIYEAKITEHGESDTTPLGRRR
jgi:hypothetical protein